MLNNNKSNKINKLKELVAAVVIVKIKKLIRKFHTTIGLFCWSLYSKTQLITIKLEKTD